MKGCISAPAVRWGRARRGFWQCCLAGCPCSGLSMPASGRNAVRELCTALCCCIWWDVWLAHSADCWSSSSGLFLLSLSLFFLSIWPLSKVSCWKLPPDHPGCARSPVLSFSPSQSDARSPQHLSMNCQPELIIKILLVRHMSICLSCCHADWLFITYLRSVWSCLRNCCLFILFLCLSPLELFIS